MSIRDANKTNNVGPVTVRHHPVQNGVHDTQQDVLRKMKNIRNDVLDRDEASKQNQALLFLPWIFLEVRNDAREQ